MKTGVCISTMLFAAACLTGCVSSPDRKPANVSPPETTKVLPLDDAISQVQAAVSNAREKAAKEKMGAQLNKVTISLQVVAGQSKTDSSTASIGVVIPPISIGGGLGNSKSESNSQQSTITLEFTNPMLLGDDTLYSSFVKAPDSKKLEQMLLNRSILETKIPELASPAIYEKKQ